MRASAAGRSRRSRLRCSREPIHDRVVSAEFAHRSAVLAEIGEQDIADSHASGRKCGPSQLRLDLTFTFVGYNE